MPSPTVLGFGHCREEKILFGLHLNGSLIALDMHKWAIFAILRALNLMTWWISAFLKCKNSWKSNFRDSKCVKMAYFALLESPKLISRKIFMKFLGFSKKVPSWPHFNASTHSLWFYTLKRRKKIYHLGCMHLNGCLIDSNRQKWAIFCHSKGSESDDLMNLSLQNVQKFMKI